mgnify:CR=1
MSVVNTSPITEKFLTKDLSLASLCYAKGALFAGIDRDDRTCWFIFENKQLCETLQQQFFAKSIDVNAKEYSDALRTLKNLIFSVD